MSYLLAELLPKYTTIECTLSRPAQVPLIFLYFVETCMDEVDLKALRETLYGTVARIRVVRAPKQIQEMLDLTAAAANPAPAATGVRPLGAARFLLPVSQCEFQLTNIFEHLQRDPWPVANDKRAQHCSGVTLSVAVGVLYSLRQHPSTLAHQQQQPGGLDPQQQAQSHPRLSLAKSPPRRMPAHQQARFWRQVFVRPQPVQVALMPLRQHIPTGWPQSTGHTPDTRGKLIPARPGAAMGEGYLSARQHRARHL
ncbi:hypothetical protein V8E36_009690 [Tilletia maclaganii]